MAPLAQSLVAARPVVAEREREGEERREGNEILRAVVAALQLDGWMDGWMVLHVKEGAAQKQAQLRRRKQAQLHHYQSTISYHIICLTN